MVLNVFARARIALAFCVLFASRASSQAPGDAEERCTSRPEHPTYNNHIRRLLDTSDYPKLLPYESDGTGGVWQTLNLDGDDTKWRTSSQLYCAETTQVCGRNEGAQNNWMITQQITIPANVTSVVIEMDSMQEPQSTCSSSASSCIENLSLYVWENTAKIGSAVDTENYRYVADISSGKGVKVELTLAGESGMMYLGIRDNGTCVSVSRLLVYYRVCEGVSEGLATVEETVVYDSDGKNIVEGQCVENSVSITESPPLLECLESGQWKLVSDCQCSNQYFKHPSKQQCLRSPPAPVGLKVSNMTNRTVTLSWSHPAAYDSNTTDELNYRVSYNDVIIDVMGGETELEVTGLTPFTKYNFSVSSENAVSSQDSDVQARSDSVFVQTLEGVAGRVVDIRIGEGEEFITWSEPNPPYGRILHYNIKIIESRTRIRLIIEHLDTSISWDTWRNVWLISSKDAKIQIQAETMVGRGEFSKEISVSTSSSEPSGSGGLSTQLMIIIILVPVVVLLLIVVILVIIILIVHRRRSLKSKPTSPLVTKSCEIEEYASVKLSPSDSTYRVAGAPPIPRSPRPQKTSQTCSTGSDVNNEHCTREDPTYYVLEGPPTSTNAYSLDPVEPVFGEPEIDYPSGENPANVASGACAQQRVYFELEAPQNSAVIKQRVNKAPTYESVKESWSQGRGPDQPDMNLLLSSGHGDQQSPLEGGGPTPPTSGGGPPSLYLAATSSAE